MEKHSISYQFQKGASNGGVARAFLFGDKIPHNPLSKLWRLWGIFSNYDIDTSKISWVFCGAFSTKAHDIAEKSSGSHIGFGAAPKPVQPYTRPLTELDLIDFGVMPELMGRIQRIVNLQPMTVEDYYRMTDNSLGFLSHIGEQYKADIRLTPEKRRELAELAARTGLGVRGIVNQIYQLVDDAIFDDCTQRRFEF